MRTTTLLLFVCLATLTFAQPISTNIHLDQFGYLPTEEKVAVFADPQVGFNANISYTPGGVIQVKDVQSNVVIYTGSLQQWNSGATHDQSGDRGWWFDFTSVQTPGSYYIYDVENNLRSYYFDIDEAIYEPILEAAGRMFYYNRCGTDKQAVHAGTNWADGMNFAQDQSTRYIGEPNNAALYKDLSGGWFDAGDYNKYVNYALEPIHNLLWAYEENENAFTDDWNIPESGNGIPDLLDEIKWEMDWILKMVNDDGTVHIKVGANSFAENASAPPSNNSFPRYYGSTCSSSEICAASMMAHAAIVFKNNSSLTAYGQLLEERAILVWQQVVTKLNSNTLDTECDDGTITASDADRTIVEQRSSALSAAIYLYALTENPIYNQYINDNINDSDPLLGPDSWDNYRIEEIDALLFYTTLPNNSNTISQQILTSFNLAITNNWNQYYGWNDDDLYRADMPDWTYHWGSSSPKAAFGVLSRLIERYNVNNTLDFEKRWKEAVHYFHGTNPMGLCYLSNMSSYGAENSAHEIYHAWFADGSQWDNSLTSFGPAPGYIVGGPNQNYNANTNLSPPYNQPAQKSYLEFNDIPNNSWEITEPALSTNAIYLRLLSGSVSSNKVELDLKAYLEGPYNSSEQLMTDQLRQLPSFATTEPFTSLGFNHVLGGGESISPSILNVSGNDAIVDWIFVELRDPLNSEVIIATQSCLLQRDGDVVSVDGVSNVSFGNIDADDIYVVLRHRNHFGIRSTNLYPTAGVINIDFTSTNTPIYGDSPLPPPQAQPTNIVDGKRVLITGDANHDGQVNTPDRNLFWRIENSSPYNYNTIKSDFDMNGTVNSIDINLYWRNNNAKFELLD